MYVAMGHLACYVVIIWTTCSLEIYFAITLCVSIHLAIELRIMSTLTRIGTRDRFIDLWVIV
jgi:hypothetical protein